jgi:LemA protein
MLSVPAIALAVVVLTTLYAVMVYNRLVTLLNRFKNAFAQIDVQLKRRYELIPNLVQTVKTYLKHERETLESVTRARNAAVSASDAAATQPENAGAIRRLMQADTSLTGALGRLFALMENYPDLKANQTIQQLMEELTNTDNRVAFARQAYNDSVMYYNTYCQRFPNLLVAGVAAFKKAQLFEADSPAERAPVRVSFD